MPRRKKEVSGVTSEEPPKKKSKSSSHVNIDASTVQWEWEADKGVWTAYSEDFNLEITEAFNNGEKELLLPMPQGPPMRFIFEKMVQKNKITGWERRVRLCIKDEDDFYAWEWENEHKIWNSYLTQTCLELENAREASAKSINIVASNRKYTINLAKMEQTNDDTGIVRKVRREKTEAKKPPSTRPKASTSDTKSAPSNGKAAKGSVGAATASASKSGRSAGTKSQASKSAAKEKDTVKTVVVKGKAPVDPECPKASVAHVYCEGKDIYDAMLNQTNLSNNNNKYYLCQLLQDDGKKSYSVWFRWGRVGKTGQNALIPCGPNLEEAKATFCKKFQDKTKNDWSTRHDFEKVPGKYDLVELDYSANDTNTEGADEVDAKSDVPVPDSKLDKKLQSLIKLICDVKSMEDAVIEMKYDARKAPLGKLKTGQIKAGYAALKKIDACIEKADFGTKLVQACDEFYTRIPHDFGMTRPPVIRTKAELKLKISLLEALSDIEIAMNILKHSTSTENPVDTHYKDLKCDIKHIAKGDGDFDMVEDYLKNTHAPTHNQYKMEIQELYAVDKEGDSDNFKDHGNRMLLWHGSRLTNWMGILSQGLRIAPPEAPVTGYMFGKGVYFADMSSKSANYCYPTRAKTTGLLLLCEVSLGNMNELLDADYNAASLPSGKHSVWGKGKVAPDPAQTFKTDDGYMVPLGKPKDTGVTNPKGYTLNYNEFIVYNVNQIKLKYLVKVKFNFK